MREPNQQLQFQSPTENFLSISLSVCSSDSFLPILDFLSHKHKIFFYRISLFARFQTPEQWLYCFTNIFVAQVRSVCFAKVIGPSVSCDVSPLPYPVSVLYGRFSYPPSKWGGGVVTWVGACMHGPVIRSIEPVNASGRLTAALCY